MKNQGIRVGMQRLILISLYSQFQCTVFSSWDNNKDWSQQLPKGEVIEVLLIATLLVYVAV